MASRLIRQCGPYTVVSLAGGALRVRPLWPGCGPPGCAVVPDHPKEGVNWCPTCRCNHVGGFLSRCALAVEVEKALNRLARQKPTRRKKKAP